MAATRAQIARFVERAKSALEPIADGAAKKELVPTSRRPFNHDRYIRFSRIIDAPIIIGILVLGALLFGADKLPKLARSAGQAKKEFLVGQAEADEAAARAREEARQRAAAQHADVMDNVEAGSIAGESVPPPTPDRGTPSS